MKSQFIDIGTCFRCIIALSNTGASLLRRNAIAEGVCVLSESMNIVRFLYPLESEASSTGNQRATYAKIAAEMKKANQKLAGSVAFSRNRHISAVDLSLNDNLDLCYVQDVLKLAEASSNNDAHIHPDHHVINIDSFFDSDVSRDLVVAIIMYNCAVGCMLLGQTKTTEEERNARLLMSSNDLFLSAFRILQPIYESNNVPRGMDSVMISSIVTVVTALIVLSKQSLATVEAPPFPARALGDIQALSKATLERVMSVLGVGPKGGIAPAA